MTWIRNLWLFLIPVLFLLVGSAKAQLILSQVADDVLVAFKVDELLVLACPSPPIPGLLIPAPLIVPSLQRNCRFLIAAIAQ